MEEFIGIGRRKTSVASVRLRPGKGSVSINGRALEEYLPQDVQRQTILAPFKKLGGNSHHDALIRVSGGGIQGQVIAMRLGLARALVQEKSDLRQEYKEEGFLTRDPRKKERKKYGLAGARKRFQFSKR